MRDEAEYEDYEYEAEPSDAGRPSTRAASAPEEAEPDFASPEDVEGAGGGRIWLAVGFGALAGALLIGVLVIVLGGKIAPAPAAANPLGAGSQPGTPAYEAPAVGYYAPQFTLPDLNNKPVSLKDYRGHPVWVNVWASWCGPCKAEMPEMKRLYSKYKGAGLVILGVDIGEAHDTVSSFVTQNGYDWTFVLDGDGRVSGSYNASGIPTHAFVDATGVIRAYRVGGLSPDVMQGFLAQIMPK